MESEANTAATTETTPTAQTPVVDTELLQLNISDQLRTNSSFMKIMATLFHYGNQAMNAAQLVIAVRALDLLPLRGETPKSTIQGIISTSRKQARDLKISDPFRIDKDGTGRQAKYAIADDVLNGVEAPEIVEIPDEPIILRPVEYNNNTNYNYANHGAKRSRKQTTLYSPSTKQRQKKKSKTSRPRTKKETVENGNSDVEVDSEDDYDFTSMASEEEGTSPPEQVEEDTIANYSLLYCPPTSDVDYISKINFTEYPIASHFAIVQQKGYSYPRFRSHEKVKIPKVHCEDKFRVTDIVIDGSVSGRLFILADGHGGPGCSEYFVRNTPSAVDNICAKYNPKELGDETIQKNLENDIKKMIQELDDDYLKLKRQQIASKEKADNDGCTLILNIFLGEWLINVNVGDSRTVLISAPEPSTAPPTSIENANTLGIDNDYKMDVVFASQDHKPYLEHLARHILENGGEFVDSVQNRVIKVDLDKLREDGNRHAKRVALKNARIRPKDYGLDQAQETPTEEKETNDTESPSTPAADGATGWATQSAVRTTVNNATAAPIKRVREDHIPSLNVARSCGDLDFKMDPTKKIISCEPDVTFIRISDQPYVDRTILVNGPHKEKRRHFLFMSTDGTFDYMYEETAERQNRAIAKVIGPMIEDGEKIGKYLLEEEERVQGETIEHKPEPMQVDKPEEVEPGSPMQGVETEENSGQEKKTEEAELKADDTKPEEEVKANEDETKANENETKDDKESKADENMNEKEAKTEEEFKEDAKSDEAKTDEEIKADEEAKTDDTQTEETSTEETKVELPRIPLLHRELTEEETKSRKIKERTLVYSARYFANREGAHGFFASTLQDYDDCTIVLVEI